MTEKAEHIPDGAERGRYLVVTGMEMSAWVAMAQGKLAEEEAAQSPALDDLMPAEEYVQEMWEVDEQPGGLYVWEGWVWLEPELGDYGVEYGADLAFSGEWRRPTPEETDAYLEGKYPWRAEGGGG